MKNYWIESGGEPVYVLAIIGYFVCLYIIGRLTLWAALAALGCVRRWLNASVRYRMPDIDP
jgi:hypothetical protein